MKFDIMTDQYLVAYIDILGQSKTILENSTYPPNQRELTQINKILKENAEYILYLRNKFREHFKHFRKLKDVFDGLSVEQKKREQRMNTFNAELRGVSDSIIITVPLKNNTEHCIPINNILATLQGICLIYNLALFNHKPIRGGVDVGSGIRIPPNEVYGSALAGAYELESDKADYPRIVVGNNLWKYVRYVETATPTTKYGKRANALAKNCIDFLANDYDNSRILDVIGKAVKLSKIGVNQDIVEKNYYFIIETQRLYRQKSDTSLYQRYKKLQNYFEKHLSVWGLNLSSM